MQTQPTYIIGLGGTGVRVLRRIKQALAGPEHEDTRRTVRLLAFDTDLQPESRNGNDTEPGLELQENVEFWHVTEPHIRPVLDNVNGFIGLRDWWTYARDLINPEAAVSGAQALRPVGRLVLFREFNKVESALRRTFEGPHRVMAEQNFPMNLKQRSVVYVVGSLAGGTGTGMHLDIALLARQWHEDQNIAVEIRGVLALPSVFDTVDEPADRVARERQRQNGYAALKELDFFQTQGDRLAEVIGDIVYPEGRPLRPKRPYNKVFLVGSTSESGGRWTRPMVLQNMAQFIFSATSMVVGSTGESRIDNEGAYFNPQGRRYRGTHGIYASMGAEAIETPSSIGPACAAACVEPVVQRLLRPDGVAPDLDILISTYLGASGSKLEELLTLAEKPDERRRRFGDRYVFSPLHASADKERALQAFQQAAGKQVQVDDLGLHEVRARASEQVERLVAAGLSNPQLGFAGALALLKRLQDRLRTVIQTPVSGDRAARMQIEDELARTGFGGTKFGQDAARLANAKAKAQNWLADYVDEQLRGSIANQAQSTVSTLLATVDHSLRRLDAAQTRLTKAAATCAQDWWDQASKQVQATGGDPKDLGGLTPHVNVIVDDIVQTILTDHAGALAGAVRADAQEAAWADLLRPHVHEGVARAQRQHMHRPPQVGDRVQRALEICKPMVQFDDVELQRRGLDTRSMFLVASFDKGRDIDLATRAGKLNQHFEIVESATPSRDDVFTIRMGHCLDTLIEVREAKLAFDKVKGEEFQKTFFLFPHVEAVRHHRLHAITDKELEPFLGIALAMGHISPAGVRRVALVLPGLAQQHVSVSDAGGLAWDELREAVEACFAPHREAYSGWLQDGGIARVQEVRQALARRREHFENWNEKLHPWLERCGTAAEKWLKENT